MIPKRQGLLLNGYIFETTHFLSYKCANQSPHWLQSWNYSGSDKTFLLHDIETLNFESYNNLGKNAKILLMWVVWCTH